MCWHIRLSLRPHVPLSLHDRGEHLGRAADCRSCQRSMTQFPGLLMRVPRRAFIAGITLLVITALGVGIYARIGARNEVAGDTLGASGDLPVTSSGSAFAIDQPIPVEGARVLRDTLVLTVRAEGQAAAWRQTTV